MSPILICSLPHLPISRRLTFWEACRQLPKRRIKLPGKLLDSSADAADCLTIRAQGIVIRQSATAYLALIERRERLYLFVQYAAERWLVFLQPAQQ
jgi:hypothetical protein